jgi:hypothetical protein
MEAAMAVVIPEVMFLIEKMEGYSDIQIAALNYELMDRLGDLEPSSTAYMARAKAFHEEVSRRPGPDN